MRGRISGKPDSLPTFKRRVLAKRQGAGEGTYLKQKPRVMSGIS
jgi:hypothetical protein